MRVRSFESTKYGFHERQRSGIRRHFEGAGGGRAAEARLAEPDRVVAARRDLGWLVPVHARRSRRLRAGGARRNAAHVRRPDPAAVPVACARSRAFAPRRLVRARRRTQFCDPVRAVRMGRRTCARGHRRDQQQHDSAVHDTGRLRRIRRAHRQVALARARRRLRRRRRARERQDERGERGPGRTSPARSLRSAMALRSTSSSATSRICRPARSLPAHSAARRCSWRRWRGGCGPRPPFR